MHHRDNTLARLIECVRADLDAQRRAEGLLDDGCELLRTAGDRAELDELVYRVSKELAGAPERARRREAVLASFAESFRVPLESVTLGSIAARVGACQEAERLLVLRAELRRTVESVRRKARKLSSLAGFHRRLVHELVEVILGEEGKNPLEDRGVLVDAQA